jgi:MFS family permease
LHVRADLTGFVTTRQLRPIHAFILLTSCGLTTLVTAILGPVLPKMQAHFAGVAQVDYFVPLTLTVPMLMMALLSIIAGALSDRFGRKRLLVGATACYSIFGLAPLWLQSLQSIFFSRVALGVMDATVMTVSTTMIGDYYQGLRRDRMQALQTTTASFLAFLLNLLGGYLGEFGWRVPFWLYAASVPLALLMGIHLWEPKPHGSSDNTALSATDPAGVTFRPWLLTGICALAVVVGTAFLIPPVHLGFLFNAIGVASSAKIGIAYALNSICIVAGTLIFGWIIAPRVSVSAQIALSMAITALGFIMMNGAGSYLSLTIAAMVNGLGAGLLLPTVVTWNMRELPFARRGLGTGAFQSALFFGMFINPVLVVGLQNELGSRAGAVSAVGFALLAGSAIAALKNVGVRARRFRRPQSRVP